MRKTMLIVFSLVVASCSGDYPVTGHYKADDKDSSIRYVRTVKGETYMHDPTIDFAFTEKDAADAKDLKAMTVAFSHKYGSAITLNAHKKEDGTYEVLDCAFHHSGWDNKGGGSSYGALLMKNVTVENGMISGEVSSLPDLNMFDVKMDIAFKFKAPMPQ
jgi:hypothetical protein